MTKFTPADLAALDAGYWAVLNRLRLQSGEFSFRDHGYQREWMTGMDAKREPLQSRAMCYMKATQGGVSETEILKSLHGLIYGRYRQGVLYLFPTADDVSEFSKARFNPLIEANRQAIGRFVKTGGKGTDTASLKKIGKSFLYLRGTRLTQQIGVGDGEKESTKLRGISVDRVVFDELDLMDEDVIAKAKGRMGASSVKEEIYISNPTLPDYGIDKVWQMSDQRHLWRLCEACGKWTCAELSFPKCVKLTTKQTGYVACDHCGREVTIQGKCEWVPAESKNSRDMTGYRWSQLSSAFNDPADVLDDFENPPQHNLADVYRLRLGLPYVAAEDKLAVNVVMACCGQDLMLSQHPGQCAMGVDVGKVKHVVIGVRTDLERYRIVHLARVESFTDIHDLAKRFNVKSAVIDARPYEDEAREFQRAEPYRIFLSEYSELSVLGTQFNPDTGIVRANRTEALDASHRVIAQKSLIIPRQGREVDEFARQCCNCAKVLETNKRSGTSIYRYRTLGTGGDHYRHALTYFLLAASGARIAVGGGRDRPDKVVSDYAVI